MEKLKEKIKFIWEIIVVTTLSIWAFGGGCLYWLVIAICFNFSPIVNEIGFYISMVVCAISSWIIISKIRNKIF